jgi:hypothetical protein
MTLMADMDKAELMAAVAARDREIEQLKAGLLDLEVQRDMAAGMWAHYKAIAEGSCQHLYEEGGSMCLRCGKVRR